MKTAAGLALLIGHAAAFPRFAMDALTAPLAADVAYKRVMARQSTTAPQGAGALPLTPPPFDASEQLVSVSGEHAFVPPGPGDARGMCPGLNALANHNYLPHNGVATIEQFVDATNSVFGMGIDLATFLAVYGAVVDGTLTSWSIDGGEHTGIGGSHNNYEGDNSPLKSDLNQYGSNQKLILEQFQTLYDLQPDASTANYNLEVLREFRGTRFQQSISENPYYVYGPFTGIAVSQAAYTFIYRFMANKSAEYPEGILNQDVLKSFMAISGESGNWEWNPGYERIPENWYKRNPLDDYTIPYFDADILYFAETQPEILDIGCNQGQVNSYNSISAETLSDSAYTASQLAKSPLCFAIEFALAELPGLTGLSSFVLAPLTSAISSVTSSLNCASIGSVNTSALTACPGFSLYGGPTGPVAPGAIQNNGD
ncbi:hypothetical protein M433DRAFT_156311 [Acidomyces richmondensis BFW]|nr:MAG: hypothetical protein FE78DRAFT_93116 [Acidomyces sp. 'richmondensis']KYG43798.1 hypothetical protein M433DRAFT_156311 [Acidomyces richmondensis BFW]